MNDHPRRPCGYYPVLLDLAGRRCVVVGGGKVAERKITALLECGANVVVISPQTTQAIGSLAQQGVIRLLSKAYTPGDLVGTWLVVAAGPPEVNATVVEDARRERALVNVVDDPERCDFIVPAVARRGPVVVAISTQGASPALARHLREMVEAQIGPEYELLAELLGRLRPEVMTVGDDSRRRRAWEAILDSNALNLLREGRAEEAEAEARRCISSALD
jgi:precorrin-2 dehydrogenase/sirohydrochlorin ferrochelatase